MWVELDIPTLDPEPNPFVKMAGALKDDPTCDEWQAIIAENRRIENEEAGIYPERKFRK